MSSVATNGVLSDYQIAWIATNLSSATVSFDGLPIVHDANRIDTNGCGTSASVVHTMRAFDSANFTYGIRVTVLPEHVTHLKSSLEYICANFRPKAVQVEPVYQLGRARHQVSAVCEEFIYQYRLAKLRIAFGVFWCESRHHF